MRLCASLKDDHGTGIPPTSFGGGLLNDGKTAGNRTGYGGRDRESGAGGRAHRRAGRFAAMTRAGD
jgi:hypothetical protein